MRMEDGGWRNGESHDDASAILHLPSSILLVLLGAPSVPHRWLNVLVMRIIAGEFRGRTLLPPQGQQTTRPITDRAKQSLFDMLTAQLDGALVYDCFAGTGSMGLEALSRGAKFCTFFEADRSAVTRLHQNIAALKVQNRSRVVAGDLFRWFELSTTRPDSTNATGADLVFLD